ncbi:MAG: hypothetical protein ACI9FR_000688 [Cryomorphaceae bacterium]|jgi:hypothetical protein
MPPIKKLTNAPRNPVARSSLMRKGGVHEKSTTTERRQIKDQIDSELDDWREAVEFEEKVKVKPKKD